MSFNFLRGKEDTDHSDGEFKTLIEFKKNLHNQGKNITDEDRVLFQEAYKDQRLGNNEHAKQKYEELLEKYNDNEIIQYNLNLLK